MGYLDFSDADLIALTRERRREAREKRLQTSPTIRIAVEASIEFSPTIEPTIFLGRIRRKKRASSWRKAQWRIGNRRCYYCDVLTSPDMGHKHKVTVDHKTPLGLGGADDESNFAICCLACNSAKGSLTEAEFRSVMSGRTKNKMMLTSP